MPSSLFTSEKIVYTILLRLCSTMQKYGAGLVHYTIIKFYVDIWYSFEIWPAHYFNIKITNDNNSKIRMWRAIGIVYFASLGYIGPLIKIHVDKDLL